MELPFGPLPLEEEMTEKGAPSPGLMLSLLSQPGKQGGEERAVRACSDNFNLQPNIGLSRLFRGGIVSKVGIRPMQPAQLHWVSCFQGPHPGLPAMPPLSTDHLISRWKGHKWPRTLELLDTM